MSTETPVWIDGPGGRLFGIVHRPACTTGGACLVMLNAGQTYRAGPRRLYVRAARDWVEQGLTVLRLDLAGLGDSQADNPIVHVDNHRTAEVDAVVAYARETLAAEEIFLLGLCAGARVALRAAARNRSVDGVVAWSCPIFHSGNPRLPLSPGEDPDRMSVARAHDNLRQIGQAIRTGRILTRQWWHNRRVEHRNDLRRIWRSILYLVRGGEHARTEFLECTDRFLESGRPLLFVYGEHDRVLIGEFMERFAEIPQDAGAAQGYDVIPDAVHHFASIDAQDAVMALTGAWLVERMDGVDASSRSEKRMAEARAS